MALTAADLTVDLGEDGCLSAFPLRGDRLYLTQTTRDLRDLLVSALADGQVSQTTQGIPFPYTLREADAHLDRIGRETQAGYGLHLAIRRNEDHEFLGMVILKRFRGSGFEIGCWIRVEFWDSGYSSEATRLLLEYAFNALHLPSIHATVRIGNGAARRVLEKLGFADRGLTEIEPLAAPGTRRTVEFFELTPLAFQAATARRVLLVSAVALIDADNRVLLQKRPPGKQLAGLWEFPGGKVDPGETPERALIREMQEELGIDARESCLAPLAFASHTYDSFHLLMPLYVCRQWRGRVQGREGQELAWVAVNRLRSYPMPPADLPLIPMLEAWL